MQLELLEAPPSARQADPVTSHEAAAAAKQLQARHHDAIVRCLREHGSLGKDGIAARTSLTGVAVARRTVELERLGRIRWTGQYTTSTSGRRERLWVAVEGGADA